MKLTYEKIRNHKEMSLLWKDAVTNSDDVKEFDRTVARLFPWCDEFTRPLMGLEILAFTDPKELVSGEARNLRKVRSELSGCNAAKVTIISREKGIRLRDYFFDPDFVTRAS